MNNCDLRTSKLADSEKPASSEPLLAKSCLHRAGEALARFGAMIENSKVV